MVLAVAVLQAVGSGFAYLLILGEINVFVR